MKHYIILPEGVTSSDANFVSANGKENGKETLSRVLTEGLVTAEDRVYKLVSVQEPAVLDPDQLGKGADDEEESLEESLARRDAAQAYWEHSIGNGSRSKKASPASGSEIPTERVASLPTAGGGYERVA